MDLKNISVDVRCTVNQDVANALIEEFKKRFMNECLTIEIGRFESDKIIGITIDGANARERK